MEGLFDGIEIDQQEVPESLRAGLDELISFIEQRRDGSKDFAKLNPEEIAELEGKELMEYVDWRFEEIVPAYNPRKGKRRADARSRDDDDEEEPQTHFQRKKEYLEGRNYGVAESHLG